MKVCRETNKPIPDFALVCPHCRKESCLDPFAASRVPAGPTRSPAKPNPPPPPPVPRPAVSSAPPSPAVNPPIAPVQAAPPPPAPKSPPLAQPAPAVPFPSGAPALSPQLETELKRLERHLRAGKRHGLWLGLSTAVAVVLAVLALGGYYASSVWGYAQLDEDHLRLERDGADQDRLAIVFRPLTGGRVGFRRADTDRETELLDRVEPGDAAAEQRFEWRWTGVREGDMLRVTHRRDWSLATRELKVPAAPPAPPLGNAVLIGEVIDATTGKPVPEAEVRLVGTPLRTKVGADGRFRIAGAPAGAAGVEVAAKNYTTQQMDQELRAASETPLRVVLSPGLAAGQIQIVLEWGKEPQDLDAHLEGPLPGGGQFHIHFDRKGDLAKNEHVSLDVDARTGRGPETLTVRGVMPGSYRYFVHDYTNRADKANRRLAQSGAVVKVYQGGQAQPFRVDQKSVGTVWNVFTFEVAQDGRALVRAVNQYQHRDLDPAAVVEKFEIEGPPSSSSAKGVRMAVTPRRSDDMAKLLKELGEGFNKFDQIEVDDILDPKKLAQYDILFLTCGTDGPRDRERFRANLRQFVSEGGTIYSSDLRYEQLAQAFPEFRDTKPYRAGQSGHIEAEVLDEGLRELLGPKVTLNFDAGTWRAAAFKGQGVITYLQAHFSNRMLRDDLFKLGKSSTKKDKMPDKTPGKPADKTSGKPVDKGEATPLLIKFPFGKGAVIFTSFHNAAQNSKTEKDLLQYLVFSAVTARAEAEITAKMEKQGLTPEEKRLLNAGAGPNRRVYACKKPGRLEFAVGFENRGARLRLTVVSPSGEKFEKEGDSSFAVEIADAAVGDWQYTITAVRVPYKNFPFTMTIGQEKPK